MHTLRNILVLLIMLAVILCQSLVNVHHNISSFGEQLIPASLFVDKETVHQMPAV
jgi:hypothetical protein